MSPRQISDLTYLADTIEHTKNFKPVDIATGVLATALKIDNSRSLLDTTSCATYTELIITDPSHPYVISAQMRFTDNQITQIDRIITDEGDWLFDAAGTLQYAQGENWDPIPEAQRDSREVIQAGGVNDASVQVPWGEPCARLEGGIPTDSCNVGVPSGLDLTNRRYVIDEVVGTVDVFLNFGGAAGLPDSQECRLESGKEALISAEIIFGLSPFAVKALAEVDIVFLFAKFVECLLRYDGVKRAAQDFGTFISSVWAVIPSDPRGSAGHPSGLMARTMDYIAQRSTSWRTGDWDGVKKAGDGFYEIARQVMAACEQNSLNPEENSDSSLLEEGDSKGEPLNKDHLM
ncbi:hypothetical protein FQN50_008170 [Emmonsiellopsis sp. PD_5]|nr:hypothetical protein FQN50_008170 [Emmonsiellopsis sp. PD_5]